jgi:hypothetical protein
MDYRIKQIEDQEDQQRHQEVKRHFLLLTPRSFVSRTNDVVGKAHERAAKCEKADQEKEHQQLEKHELIPRMMHTRSRSAVAH